MGMNNLRDLVGGLVVTAVGLAFLNGALNMRLGTTMQMGPGYFPMLMAIVVTGLGVVITALSFFSAAVMTQIEWRPMFAVLGAVAAFAFVLANFGLVPAMVTATLLATFGDRTSKFYQSVIMAVFAALLAWLVFRVGLGLQLPAFRIPLWLR